MTATTCSMAAIGNDTLNGGDDNDTIIGGAGNDTIDVGGGVNTIVYNAPNFGNDIINSFDARRHADNQDRIDLSGLGVTAANFANRVFETGTAGEHAHHHPGRPLATSERSGSTDVNAAIDITDFTLAAAPTATINGSTTPPSTITGRPAPTRSTGSAATTPSMRPAATTSSTAARVPTR